MNAAARWTRRGTMGYTLVVARKFAGKTPEQLARAEAERAANALAKEEGRPLPFPNPWDVLDPTKLPPGASDDEIQERCEAFSKLCAPRPRIVHEL